MMSRRWRALLFSSSLEWQIAPATLRHGGSAGWLHGTEPEHPSQHCSPCSVCIKTTYNSKREPSAHDVVLHRVRNDDWHSASNGIHNLCHQPIQMEEDDRAKSQRKTSNSKHGEVAVVPTKGHTGQHEGRPC